MFSFFLCTERGEMKVSSDRALVSPCPLRISLCGGRFPAWLSWDNPDSQRPFLEGQDIVLGGCSPELSLAGLRDLGYFMAPSSLPLLIFHNFRLKILQRLRDIPKAAPAFRVWEVRSFNGNGYFVRLFQESCLAFGAETKLFTMLFMLWVLSEMYLIFKAPQSRF